MHKTLIFALLAFLLQYTYSQQEVSEINGNFKHIPFEQFITEVERSTTYKFYYNKEWISDIQVNISAQNAPIDRLLNEILKHQGLNFYIDNEYNVFIYKGKEISARLPQYKINERAGSFNKSNEANYLTESEKKYIEGKKVADLELLTIGDKHEAVAGQTSFINGRITDITTGEPLIGATVYVEELEMGAATDIDGHFNLALKPGRYLISASSLSMRQKKFYIQVNTSGSVEIELEKELQSIDEVRVVADRHDNVKGIQMGYERLTAKSMKEIPAVMGEKDLLKVAQLLPGVQSSGEGSAGLNVRGGTADQNLFYINKLPVYNTSHLFGFFTAFSPDIVRDFSIYKSNIPAKYGGRISSIFDISTRQGNKKEFFGKGGISPVTAHAAVEGPIIKDKSSFVLSYRGTYSDWILSQMQDQNLRNSSASFYDISGSVNTALNNKNIIKIFGYKSSDNFSLSTTDDYNYSNAGGTINWKHIFSSKLSAELSAITSDYKFGHNDKNNISDAHRQEYSLNHDEIKLDFLYLSKLNHRISFGGSSILYNLDRGNVVPYGEESNWDPFDLGKEKGLENAVYLSDEFLVGHKLTVLAGLRLSFYSQLGPSSVNEYFTNSPIEEENIKEQVSYGNNKIIKSYPGLEPRIALNYRLGEYNSIKTSYNRGKQYIFMLSNTIAISPTDQWKLCDYHLKPPVSDQLSLGYYHDIPKKGLVTSIEVYGKKTNNVVEYKDGADFISPKPIETQLLQGEQESYGVEFMAKKSTGKLTGWVSYTYSRSWVMASNPTTGEQINNGLRYRSNYDRPHSFNIVSNLRANRRLSVSTNLVYSTGRPITYPEAKYGSNGQYLIHYSKRNHYRIPDYFRIDLSINIEGNLNKKKWLHSYWMINVYNITGRKNAYSVYFESNNGQLQGYKLSVFGQPVVTLSWNFKFGNYVSE